MKNDNIITTATADTLEAKIESLKELEEFAAEIKAEIDSLKDCIKAEMLAQDTDEMTVGKYIVRWTSVLSNRFDSTTFKREHAEMYKQYTKQTASALHKKSPLRNSRPKHSAKS